MKNNNKILLIALMSLFGYYKSYSNSLIHVDTPRLVHYNYDTVLYLNKDFNDSMSLYEGKPLKLLLKKVEIAPKYISFIPSSITDSVYNLSICLVTEEQSLGILKQDFGKKYYNLDVTFTEPIQTDELIFFLRQQGSFLWTRGLKNYLQNRIIKKFKFNTL